MTQSLTLNQRKTIWQAAVLLMAIVTGGCHVLDPQAIPPSRVPPAPELLAINDQPLEIGKPHKVLDTAGWVVGIPGKVLLWDRRIDNHHITEPTIEATTNYLQAKQMAHVKVRVNQYAPLQDWKRLRANKNVAWPYRYTLGVLALGGEAILPGRLFGGDHYNPFTQTVHLYSDVPAIALHELGHANDFSRRTYPGTYAAAYLFAPTWHETIASREVFSYLYQQQDRNAIIEANRILYPAYGTYLGSGMGKVIPSAALPMYYGTVVAGHINGRMLSRDIDEHLAEYRYLISSGGEL